MFTANIFNEFDKDRGVREGWKVLHRGTYRRSCVMSDPQSGMVRYKQHTVTRPRGGGGNKEKEVYGPLAVFVTRRDAERFATRGVNPITRCVYRRSERRYLSNQRDGTTTAVPRGTDYAEWVLCLE